MKAIDHYFQSSADRQWATRNSHCAVMLTVWAKCWNRDKAIILILISSLFIVGANNKLQAQNTLANYSTGSEVPVTSNGFTASGKSVNFSLNYAPATGTQFMVVKNTSLNFINGNFSNLAQGQEVVLNHAGINYRFVANYYGGTGNDLVLHWARNKVVGFGSNGFGQLGNNLVESSNLPVATTLNGLLDGKTIFSIASLGYHSLALCADGSLASWGRNSEGQLGNGSTGQSNEPVAVLQATGALMGKTVIAIATGEMHSLALCSDGTLVAWGANSKGQLGNNSYANSAVPVAVYRAGVLASKTIIAIAAGEQHSLALCSDGTIAAWGWNIRGQLGDNSNTDSSIPVATVATGVLAGKTVTSISAGYFLSLAVCSDGTLAAWGQNDFGELGNNSTVHSSVPVLVNSTSGVLAGKTVVSASGGIYHCLARCSDGTLVAWGRNYYGTLGNGSTTNSSLPVAIASTTSALANKAPIAISAGGHHNLVVCSDGTLVGWGLNNGEQLGSLGTQTDMPTALSISSLPADQRVVIGAAAARIHSLAIIALGLEIPTVTSLSPTTGTTSGGTNVTITGSGFSGATSVNFGGTAATGLVVVNDTTLICMTPARAAGSASVLVTTPVGSNSANSLFTYVNPNADISVSQINPLTDDVSTVAFGAAVNGTNTSRTFTISNPGAAPLTSLAVTRDGSHASEFLVSSLSGASIPVGLGTVTFTVTFSPSTAGIKTAAIHISSNVVGAKNPFDIALTGQSLSFTQDSDGDGLNDASEFQMAMLGFNWQVNQTALVNNYYASANGAGLFTTSQVQTLNVGMSLKQRDANGQVTLNLSVEKSTTLQPGSFQPLPITAPQTTFKASGDVDVKFTVPESAAFFRLQAK